MKRIICIAAASLALVSCGRTVHPAGQNTDITHGTPGVVQPTVPPAEPPTEEPTDPPTEPTTFGPPPRVEIDLSMPRGAGIPQVYVIGGFETVLQCPELPTGCEITALTEALNFYGFGVDKIEMCDVFMPIDHQGGLTMNDAYIGDPRMNNGFGCNACVIARTANDYFEYLGSDWYAADLTGIEFDEMLWHVSKKRPVIVWSTIGQRETHAVFEKNLNDYFNPYQHCLVVYGFDLDENLIYCADPLEGNMAYDLERFQRIYNNMNKQSVVLVGNEESAGVDYTTEDFKDNWLHANRPELFPDEVYDEPAEDSQW